MTQSNASNTPPSDAESDAEAAPQVSTGVAPGILDRVFRAALFDMDGTLIDSTPAVDRAWTTWGDEWGLAPDFRVGMHGKPAMGLVRATIAPHNVDEAFARIMQLELSDVDDVVPLRGASALLDSLPDANRAIVTSCTRDLARLRITASGIPRPATVVSFDDTERGKPFPDPFLEGARQLGVDPRDCVVFEDAPAGLTAGRAAGCSTVGVVGTVPASELDADLVVDGLGSLRVVLVDGGFRLELTD